MSQTTMSAETASHLEFQINLLRLCAVPHLRESVKPEAVGEAEYAEIPATKALKSLTSQLR